MPMLYVASLDINLQVIYIGALFDEMFPFMVVVGAGY